MSNKTTAELIAKCSIVHTSSGHGESSYAIHPGGYGEKEDCQAILNRLAELEARADKLEMALELWQQMWPGMRDCVVNEAGWHMRDAHKDNMDAAYKYGEKALQPKEQKDE